MSPTAERTYGSRSGVTLIELLVAMAIFVAVISSVMLMFTSVTNTVRQSYRTMDVYEQARNALLSVERDVKVSFTAPVAGAELQFYGEPYGFTLIGIAPDQKLGRLTYVVHRDTSRMSNPGTSEGRGETVTLMRNWDEVAANFPVSDELNAYYPDPRVVEPPEGERPPSPFLDFQVEVVHGLLLRYYEPNVTDMADFPLMDRLLTNPMGGNVPWIPRPYLTLGQEGTLGTADRFPWLASYLWDYLDPTKMPPSTVSVPWYVREKIQMSEECHYWIQLLQGPGIRPIQPWDLMNIWWAPASGGVGLLDQFWWDNLFWDDWKREYGMPSAPPIGTYDPDTDIRPVLWDYVVARNFVLETYLLNPATGERIVTSAGLTVPVVGPNPFLDYAGANMNNYKNYDPIFQYAVENPDNRVTKFNTLYNLNHPSEISDPDGGQTDRFNAFRRVTDEIQANIGSPNLDPSLSKMMEARQFYDIGNPLQTRMPASFDITFWVLNEPGVTGAPPDLYRFSQTIHIPSGHMRRSRAVK